MAEISRLMGVAPSTLVYVVDGLTEKRLVRRVKDSEDRRREPLLLEKKGADLFARFSKMDVASTLVRSLGGMPEQNRRKLLDLLKELATGLKASERLYASEELLEASAPSAVSRFGARRNNKRREMKS